MIHDIRRFDSLGKALDGSASRQSPCVGQPSAAHLSELAAGRELAGHFYFRRRRDGRGPSGPLGLSNAVLRSPRPGARSGGPVRPGQAWRFGSGRFGQPPMAADGRRTPRKGFPRNAMAAMAMAGLALPACRGYAATRRDTTSPQ